MSIHGHNNQSLRVEQVHDEITDKLRQVESDFKANGSKTRILDNIKKTKACIREFEAAPKLLDSHLHLYMDILSSTYLYLKEQSVFPELANTLTELVYDLTKIRGYKYVANFLSSDVYLVHRLVEILSDEAIEDSDCECFLVLMWLTRLLMVPFPLRNVSENLEEQLLEVATRFLSVHSNASKTQRMSLILLSHLVTRPDSVGMLHNYINDTAEKWSTGSYNFKLGHLMAINQILKSSSNREVALCVEVIHDQMIIHDLILVKYRLNQQLTNLNILYLIKVSAKLANFYLLRSDYQTVLAIINNLVNDIMNPMEERFDAALRESMAKNMSRIVGQLAGRAVNFTEQLIWYMIRQLRIPELMIPTPKYAETLTLNSSNLYIAKFHTVLLFLGFLALTRKAPVSIIPTILSIVHHTLFVSQKKLSFVQGTQVRDSSCFCIWAVFKLVSQEDFLVLHRSNSAMVGNVFTDLLKVVVFDDDFTIRRCGIAVLQEFVGRFGSVYFREVCLGGTESDIGEFTIKFTEIFGASAVASMADSFELIHFLVELGFPSSLFIHPMLAEILRRDASFLVQKLCCVHLGRLLSRQCTPKIDLPLENITLNQVQEMLADLYQDSCLYGLAELLRSGLLSEELKLKISDRIMNSNYDHHCDTSDKGEALLRWINACLYTGTPLAIDTVWDFVFSVSRSQASGELELEFCTLFEGLSNNLILPDNFMQIWRYLKHGNELLSRAIFSYNLSPGQVTQLLSLASDSSIDATARARMVSGFNGIIEDASEEVYNKIIDLLDDYTLTKQGDVGLKVRFACLELIKINSSKFVDLEQLKVKLIRIAGEAMDKLRVEAFCLLCELDGVGTYTVNYDKYNSEYAVYFTDYFDYYQFCSEEEQEAFWRGIVHCAGAITGVNTLINISFQHVLRMVLRGSSLSAGIFTHLMKLLRGVKFDPRTQKTLIVTLNVLGKFFDAGVVPPPSLNYETLFVRAYNLHINNLTALRVGLVLKIFHFISIMEEVPLEWRVKARKRVIWVACRHTNAQIRVLASESLFEIANDLKPADPILCILDSTKWDNAKEAGARLQQLEAVYLNM